jgi:hypothetical protein
VLEVRAAGDGGLVKVGGGAEILEPDIEDGVRLREQACGLRRGLGAEVESESQRGDESSDDEPGEEGSSARAVFGVGHGVCSAR